MAYRVNLTNQNFNVTTDAIWRTWVQFVHDGLAAAGWVQTADTGQINISTALATTAVSQNRGYEIWRMADTLQATKPVFMKLEYGSGAAGNTPTIWLTVGTGSNGSGTITGIVFARQNYSGNLNATTAQFLFSGDTNRFTLSFNNQSNANQHLVIGIERMKDSALEDIGDGVLVVANAAFINATSGQANFATCPFTGVLPAVEQNGGCLIPSTDSTLDGVDVAFFPPIFFNFGKTVYHGKNFFGYRNNEIADQSIEACPVGDETIDYFCFGSQIQAGWLNFFSISRNNNRVMMRY